MYRVVEVIEHPDSYNSNSMFHVNDIALLKVERVGDKDDGTFVPEPICMPEGEIVEPGMTCYAIGWGHTQYRGQLSSTLLEVDLDITEINECSSTYLTYTDREVFTDGRNICAGNKYGGKDTCTGDSGGPLMCQVQGRNLYSFPFFEFMSIP